MRIVFESPKACFAVVLGIFALMVVAPGAMAAEPTVISPREGMPRGAQESLNVIWSQPADLNGSKISSEIISQLDLVSEVANDFSYPTDTRVTSVAWWGGPYEWESGDPEITIFNIHFYDDNGCSPGNLVEYYFEVEPTRSLVGDDGLGQPVYRYEAPVSVPILGGQTYWVSVQADYHFSPPQWGRQQATASAACESMILSDYFGYPSWAPASGIAGEPWDASHELEINTPTIQACCFTNGLCEMLLPFDCSDAGGESQGEATFCSPNPCPQPDLEACCILGGFCFLAPAEDCLAENGDPQGTDTVCDPNPCPQTGEACCLFSGFCVMLDPENCLLSEGDPQGPGTVCDPNPCDPAELEACCFEDGSCLEFSVENCDIFNGIAQGPGTVCDPNPCPQPPPRACCFEDGSCQMLTPIDCSIAGGLHGVPDSVCEPNPCPQPETEACCFEDGTCQMLLVDDCDIDNGVSAGGGTTCDPNDCAIVVPTETISWGEMKVLYR